MLYRRLASATLALLVAGLAHSADGQNPLTGLPVPDAASGMKLYGPPVRLNPARVCKSTQVTEFYTTADFMTSAALSWYGVHLKGFTHLHGYGAGRTQDAFVNADGSVMVVVTGSPGPDKVDSKAYAISYATLKPGMPQKTTLGLLTQKIIC